MPPRYRFAIQSPQIRLLLDLFSPAASLELVLEHAALRILLLFTVPKHLHCLAQFH